MAPSQATRGEYCERCKRGRTSTARAGRGRAGMKATMPARIGVRWTLGDVGDRGFEALRLSIWGARKVFGPDAGCAVCVNTIPVEEARRRTGDVPGDVVWHDATGDLPEFLRTHL